MILFRPQIKNDKDATIIFLTQGQTHPLFKGELEKGDIYPVLKNTKMFLFVGLGKPEKLSLTELRVQVRKALSSNHLKKAKSVEIIPHDKKDEVIHAFIEGVMIGGYVWDKYKSRDKNDKTIKNKEITLATESKQSFLNTITICEGVNLTRDLVNDNADTTTSVYLEQTVKNLVRGHKNIDLVVLNEKQLKAKGLNLHLAVNQASRKEPKLIIVHYQGGSLKDDYTCFLGKGLTFDTGGLNLKPTGSIETMKMDMAGAAAVCGILKNTISLKIKKNLMFVLGIAENAIGSGAYKPGDVITGYAGKSVEIGNTDAEGRLVLADALSYITKNYNPKRIIDLATLTGACVVGLGFDYTGLFSNDDKLANQLLQSAGDTDDRAWRLPVYKEAKEYIKSPIADLKNTSSVKGGGAITAAEFLHQFIGDTLWAHLDIAGSAYAEGSGRMYYGYGATGAGVRLLTHFLMNT
ncbi:MAG: leucyl aminopeptidase [Candidatus Omnitrophica bacterium]|nr:leucyl aminopeptidase [Candidatus Omnitrophota bacterium]